MPKKLNEKFDLFRSHVAVSGVMWMVSMSWRIPFKQAKHYVLGVFEKAGEISTIDLFEQSMAMIEKEHGPWSSRALEDLKYMRRRSDTEDREEMIRTEDRHDDKLMPTISAVLALGAYEPVPTEAMKQLWPLHDHMAIPQKPPREQLLTAAVGLIAAIERIDRAEARAAGKVLSPVWSRDAGEAVAPKRGEDDDEICESCGKTKRECRENIHSQLQEMPEGLRQALNRLFEGVH